MAKSVPKWVPNDSQIGGPRQIFAGPIWATQIVSNVLKFKLKSRVAFNFQFCHSGAGSGVENDAKTGPETASGRNWAVRASWEAPGVYLGIWYPKSKTSSFSQHPKCWVLVFLGHLQ